MIGLLFLVAGLLWLVLTIYLTIKVPRWLGLKGTASWLLRLLLIPLFLVGPFVDEIVGMGQFERLCEKQAVLHVDASVDQVKRAKVTHSDLHDLPGYWVNISASRSSYIDLDTGKVFMTFDDFTTRGGRVAGLALLGGRHWCSAQSTAQFKALKNRIDIQELLDKGYKS
jgi:hypothetical protein